ncbi:MAG: hypothetical protein ACO1TE_13965 [Prosthecobacter sp.]
MKTFPRTISWNIDERRAVEKAIGELPYGQMNPHAAEVKAQAIADFRKAQAEKEQSDTSTATKD